MQLFIPLAQEVSSYWSMVDRGLRIGVQLTIAFIGISPGNSSWFIALVKCDKWQLIWLLNHWDSDQSICKIDGTSVAQMLS